MLLSARDLPRGAEHSMTFDNNSESPERVQKTPQTKTQTKRRF
jgi:hypothetical protein